MTFHVAEDRRPALADAGWGDGEHSEADGRARECKINSEAVARGSRRDGRGSRQPCGAGQTASLLSERRTPFDYSCAVFAAGNEPWL